MTAPIDARRERLVRVLSAAAFLIFFQAYMVAPILPHLARAFDVPAQTVVLAVPAYLIPYGIATLVYGALTERIGRRRLILGSLVSFVLLTALTATAQGASHLIAWRLVTGLGASAVVPLGLVVIGTTFPYGQRGRPLGWLFGAMAGGAAFGSSFGAILEPVIGWRGLFVGAAAMGALVFVALFPCRDMLGEASAEPPPARAVLTAYGALLGTRRGRSTYGFVLVNAILHSGMFTWLGVYFERRFSLGAIEIGLTLLGYGVPGFLFGPLIGRVADRHGRRRLIPLGIAFAALCAGTLALPLPLLVAALMVTLLSLGYDLTQPMLAGIVSSLGGQRPALAMGLNVFTLFVGFGIGSVLFGTLVPFGFPVAFGVFAGIAAVAALIAVPLFANELPKGAEPTND